MAPAESRGLGDSAACLPGPQGREHQQQWWRRWGARRPSWPGPRQLQFHYVRMGGVEGGVEGATGVRRAPSSVRIPPPHTLPRLTWTSTPAPAPVAGRPSHPGSRPCARCLSPGNSDLQRHELPSRGPSRTPCVSPSCLSCFLHACMCFLSRHKDVLLHPVSDSGSPVSARGLQRKHLLVLLALNACLPTP